MLDVGTGTGVLARIARARGAAFVAATDIDREALASARENSKLDPTGLTPIEITEAAPDSWGARFDLVVANILEGPLSQLAPLLARALSPGGQVLLSGFTRLQVPALEIAFEKHGLRKTSVAYLDDWALLITIK